MNRFLSIKEGQDYLYNNSENFEVEDLDTSRKLCYIFFSSNGIYEDSINKFYKSMIEENRYEWKSIAEAVKKRKCVGRIIYVRDVYKKYYIYGINKEINTVDKVLDKLKELTEGYKVVTIGISSGGYMAAVTGGHLSAERVFSISGQFEIKSCINEDEANKVEDKEYFNIVEMIKNNKNVKVYYFCPIGCEFDKKNYELVRNVANVRSFLFNSDLHADTVYPFTFPDIFCARVEKLENLERKYNGIIWNKVRFAIKTFTWQGVWEFIVRAANGKFSKKNIKKMWDVK